MDPSRQHNPQGSSSDPSNRSLNHALSGHGSGAPSHVGPPHVPGTGQQQQSHPHHGHPHQRQPGVPQQQQGGYPSSGQQQTPQQPQYPSIQGHTTAGSLTQRLHPVVNPAARGNLAPGQHPPPNSNNNYGARQAPGQRVQQQQPSSSARGGTQPQPNGWTVPNPLLGSSASQQSRAQLLQHQQQQQHYPPQQQPSQVQQARMNVNSQQQQVQRQQQQQFQLQVQQQQQQSAPSPQRVRVTSAQQAATGKPRPKVVLSQASRQALAKAIWSAIRSPTGQVAPDLMAAALKTGLPKHAILNAARVAREREAAKRLGSVQQAQQQQAATKVAPSSSLSAGAAVAAAQQQRHQHMAHAAAARRSPPTVHVARGPTLTQARPSSKAMMPGGIAATPARATPASAASSTAASASPKQQQQQQQQNAVDMQAMVKKRSKWRRAQNGVFMMQKGRFLAVPFSVGAMVQSQNVQAMVQEDPTAKRREQQKLLSQAVLIQQQLRKRLQQSSAMAPQPPSSTFKQPTVALLDPEKFRRIKMEPKKFANGFNRVVRKSRQLAAEAMNKQQKELVKQIVSHQQEFFKFHKQRKAEQLKLAKAIRDSFDKEQKKKEKDAVQAEKARLAALKANDMTAYSKLLEETRNDRLQFLMDKTEKQFTKISSLLQQRSEEDGAKNTAGGTSYYASAHLKSEEVRQPSILVGGDLKGYQLTGLQWLVSLYNNKLNGILADEMGLGKTIQAISLVAYLMEYKHNLGPFLVIVPLSTLSNWQNEFAKWCPSARTICYKGTPTQRKDIFKHQVSLGHFNVLLTTYEYIIKDKKYLRKLVWQYAIVDEGHRMKNANSKFAVTLGTLYTTKYRILLTGTPLMNDLSELWSLLNFLLPEIFNSVETFDQWFSAPFAQFGGTGGDDENDSLLTNEERILIIHRLHELLRPFMLRRVKSEVLDQLPEKVEKVVRCELSSWQKELYKQISAKAITDTAEAAQVPTRGLNNVVMQLRKVCNHPYLFTPEGYHMNEQIIRSSGKVALLDDMLPKLKTAGHRVLMFTQMTAVMTILEDYFAFRGYLSLRLDGSTPAEEREKRMYRFNAPDSPYFIFLLSTRAGGLGLNLTAADTVIIFDSDWNPMMDLQAQDRAHRIGQRSDVSVFRLITYSPVEEKILSRATEKLNVSELVVESGKFNKESVESDNSLERKRIMEVLLTDFDAAPQTTKQLSEKSGSDDGGDDEEDDNGSDSDESKEDLNELFSNNEADYQLYSEMDRKLLEEGGPRAPLFTSAEDIPHWVLHPQQRGKLNAFATADDEGSRKRKAVVYDDGLTEKQFMRQMDKQIIEEEQARKRAKTTKSKPSSAAVASLPADEDVAAAPLANSDLTDWTFRKLISCSKSVVALKDPSTKRRLAEIFLEKPDPATFPDYYEVIEKPIAINDILRKCRAKLYPHIREFRDDWKLMFANARRFNGDDSWVVQDAVALEKELERVLKKNGFTDDDRPPTSKKKKKKLRIKLSLKDLKSSGDG